MQGNDHPNPSGWVSRLQRFSTKDGPGIRTTAFLKGCTLDCPWCSNPELISPSQEIIAHRSLCIRCGNCCSACPTGALSWQNGEVLYNPARCDTCGTCIQVCPQEVYAYVGERMESNQLARELLRDRVFFEVSKGGVTFSGGEAALQQPFVHATAIRLQEENTHVALDTAGNVAWEYLENLSPVLNLVLYDIKFSHTENHRQWLGIGNERVLDNLDRLSRTEIPIWIRLVILPGLNDTAVEIQSRLSLAASTRHVERVDLLPYHTYGIGKYRRLGRDYRLPDMEPPSRERMEELLALALSYGLNAHIGG